MIKQNILTDNAPVRWSIFLRDIPARYTSSALMDNRMHASWTIELQAGLGNARKYWFYALSDGQLGVIFTNYCNAPQLGDLRPIRSRDTPH
jgi:hypothetical protein